MPKRDVQRRIDTFRASSGSGVAYTPTGSGGGGGGMVVHGLVSEWHTGSLMDFTEYVAHVTNPDAHHKMAYGGDGITVGIGTDAQRVSVKLDDLANDPGLEFNTAKLRVGLLGGLYADGGAVGLGQPAALSASTTNAVAAGARGDYTARGHSHQVLAYADGIAMPGQLMKTDAEGDASIRELTTNKVIGPNDLHLSAGNMITVTQGQVLRSVGFNPAFPVGGWQINPVTAVPGQSALTIGAIQADELFVRIFVANETRVDRGEFYIAKSYGFLSAPFKTPAALNSSLDAGGNTVRVYFEDSPAFGTGQIFGNNHWIMFQIYDDSGGGLVVTKVWGQVSSYRDEDPAPYNKKNQQSFVFTLRAGPINYDLSKGAFAVGWGASGQAVIKFSAVDIAGNPYMKLTRWQTTVIDGVSYGPNAPAAHTDLVHVGALSASSVAHQGTYGIVLSNGGSQSVEVSESGVFLTNANIIASDGTNRTVEILSSGNLKLGKNVSSALDTGFSFVASSGNVIIGQPAGQKILWDGTTKTLSVSAVVTILPNSNGFGDFLDGNMDNIDDGTNYGRIKMTIIKNGEIQVHTGAFNTKDVNLRGWNIGVGEIVGQYDGADQVVLNTLGQVAAGGNNVVLSATGLDMATYQLAAETPNPDVAMQKAVSWWSNVLDRSVAPITSVYTTLSSAGSGSRTTFVIDVEPGNPYPNGNSSIVLIGRGNNTNVPTELWFNYIDQFIGIPGIFPSRNPLTLAATVQFSGSLRFQASLLKDSAGTINIGTSGTPFDTLYVNNIVAGSITGSTQLSGQVWQFDADNMYVRSNAAADRTLYVANQNATYRMHLDVEGNIVVGGLVDGVDVAVFKGLFDAHAATYTAHVSDANAHHAQAHGLDSADHTGTLSWAKVSKTGSALADIVTRPHSALTGITANDHHAQSHVLATNLALGDDHTISGATAGHVLRATAANAARFMQLLITDLGATGNDWDVVSLTAANTVGLRTPTSAPSGAALLKSDANGGLTLRRVSVGTALTLNSGGDLTVGPDIQFDGNALIASEGSLYINLDSDDATGATNGAAFRIGRDAATSAATYFFTVTDAGRVGIGDLTPSYELDVTGEARATVALRTATAYVTTKVQTPLLDTASGNMSLLPAGDLVLDPGGSDVLPGGNSEDDMGDYNRKWRTFFAAEAYFEVLVAQEVMATIGGRVEVTPTTTLIADLAAAATTMDVKHDNLRNGEYAYMQGTTAGGAGWQFEAIRVVSAATVITGGYRYTITRNLDGTGVNAWVAGDGVASLQKNVGEGHISLAASSTVYNHIGPTMTIYSRNSVATWNAVTPTAALGNLESFVGYGTPTFGLAIGNDLTKEATTGFKGLTADAINGLRMFSTAISIYDGATQTFYLAPDGSEMWLGPSSADKRLSWTAAGGGLFEIAGKVTATSGYIGTAAGGWEISSSGIRNSSDRIRIYGGGTGAARIEVGTGLTGATAGMVSRGGGHAIWAGATYLEAIAGAAPFSVTLAGALYASSAEIAGKITATSGSIANWDIGVVDANTLSSGNIKLIAGATNVARLEVGTGAANTGAGIIARNNPASAVAIWAGQPYSALTTAPFRVTLGGTLYAESAEITGTVSAGSGNVLLDTGGVKILASTATTFTLTNRIKFYKSAFDSTGANEIGFIGSYGLAAENTLRLGVRVGGTNSYGKIFLTSYAAGDGWATTNELYQSLVVSRSNVFIGTVAGLRVSNVGSGMNSPVDAGKVIAENIAVTYNLDVGGDLDVLDTITAARLTITSTINFHPGNYLDTSQYGRVWSPGQNIGGADQGQNGITLTHNAQYNAGWKGIVAGQPMAAGVSNGLFWVAGGNSVAANGAITWTTLLGLDAAGNFGITGTLGGAWRQDFSPTTGHSAIVPITPAPDPHRLPFGFRKFGDMVWMKGSIALGGTYGSGEAQIGTMPAGYRPDDNVTFTGQTINNSPAVIEIRSTGQIVWKNPFANARWVSLDGFYYPV